MGPAFYVNGGQCRKPNGSIAHNITGRMIVNSLNHETRGLGLNVRGTFFLLIKLLFLHRLASETLILPCISLHPSFYLELPTCYLNKSTF